MASAHSDRAVHGKFYTIMADGFSRSEPFVAEVISNGTYNSWHLRICERHATLHEASAILKKARNGELPPNTGTVKADLDTAYVEEIEFCAVPITLSDNDIKLGRALAVVNNIPTDKKYGSRLPYYVPKVPKLEKINTEDKFPITRTHYVRFYDSGYISPSTPANIIAGFKAASKAAQPTEQFILDNRVQDFLKHFSYTRTDLNGMVEEFDPHDLHVWESLKNPDVTPLWSVVAYTVQKPISEQELSEAQKMAKDEAIRNIGILAQHLDRRIEAILLSALNLK